MRLDIDFLINVYTVGLGTAAIVRSIFDCRPITQGELLGMVLWPLFCVQLALDFFGTMAKDWNHDEN